MTDGGLETTLIFLEGQDLPHFAAFLLLETPGGEGALRKYFRTYAGLAGRFGTGLVLETATWRANPGWGGPPSGRACPWSSPSRSRPTGGSRRGSRWGTRSRRWTRPPRATPPTS